MKKIVITGGPYSGKTTTLETISKEDHVVVPEAAMMVIEELNKEFGSPEKTRDWRNNPENFIEFQEKICQKQIFLEDKFEAEYKNTSKSIFLDRGIIDGIAYCNLKNVLPTDEMMLSTKDRNYDVVIVLDTLKNFDSRQGTGRVSSYNDSLQIRDNLIKTYENYGYKTKFVPEMPLEKRVLKIKKIASLQ